MIIAGHTHIGRIRSRNEDAMGWDEAAGVAVVADGMGGHPAGDVASRLTVEAILEAVREQRPADSAWLSGGGDLRSLIRLTHRAILSRVDREPAMAGMGSTVVMAAADDAHVVVAHVGDSRAYRFHEGRLSRLTRDHNLAQEALDHEWITPEQFRQSPERHQLTQAMGIGPDVDPDVTRIERSRGDLFLLCTDGLTGEIHDREIEQILEQHAQDPAEAVRLLVHMAVEHGGRDNVTVVLLKI